MKTKNFAWDHPKFFNDIFIQIGWEVLKRNPGEKSYKAMLSWTMELRKVEFDFDATK